MNDKLFVPSTMSSPASLKVVEPRTLFDHMNEVYDSISRRAFSLFELDGGMPGHELDHWFKAEQELLHPVHVGITDVDGNLSVKAEVPGFSADELQVSLEPNRLTIAGKKTASHDSQKKGETVYQERCSSEILRVIELPAEVDASKASATLKNGVLELMLPKAAETKATRVAVRAA
jgi:HSP20 family molecular chaperone IbpA